MKQTATAVPFDPDQISTAVWFGDSWCAGTELEKCMGSDYESKDQHGYRHSNRFSGLVCDHFGFKELNLAQEGISPEHVMLKVLEHRQQTLYQHDEIYLIFWPSFQRYFWIDQSGDRQDIRWCTEHKDWYRSIDNAAYQQYNIQRTIWATVCFLEQQGVPYVMANIQSRVYEPWYFPMQYGSWLLPVDQTLGHILDADLEQGFPSMSQKHRYFWPAENHPNVYGHKQIAKTIINYLSEKKNVSTKFKIQ